MNSLTTSCNPWSILALKILNERPSNIDQYYQRYSNEDQVLNSPGTKEKKADEVGCRHHATSS